MIISFFSHYYREIQKFLKVYEENLEEIDYIDLENFLKLDYDELILSKLEQSKVFF